MHMHIQVEGGRERERDMVSNHRQNFLANSTQLALSSLCMLHGGVHAALVNQDYSAATFGHGSV